MEKDPRCLWKKETNLPHQPEPIVLDRVTTRPATSRAIAPILALLALAMLLTGCIYYDGYPSVYGYGYYGDYYGGHGYGHHRHGYGYGHGRWH
jgi:hypothetical protein